MNIEELQKNLDEQKAKLPPLIEEMDNIFLQIKADMPAAVKKWILKEVEEKISLSFKIFQSLNANEVREMKNKLNSILDNIPAQVEVFFRQEDLWPHRKPYTQKDSEYRISLSVIKGFFNNLVTPAGKLLIEYGLFINPQGTIIYWFPTYGDSVRFDDRYPIGFPRSEIVEKYQKCFYEFSETWVSINKLNSELEGAKAVERWNLM